MKHADQYMILLSFLFNWDSMNEQHFENDHDDDVQKFLDQRMALLNKKMDKLSAENRDIINQINPSTVTNFIEKVLNSKDSVLKDKLFQILPKYFE